jgi:hypothetical protein
VKSLHTRRRGPHPPNGGTKLKATLTGSSSQNIVKQKGLVFHADCNLACAVEVVGDLDVKGVPKPYKMQRARGSLGANRLATVKLTMSRTVRSAIDKALKHHKRVSAFVVLAAQASGQTVGAKKTIRVKS